MEEERSWIKVGLRLRGLGPEGEKAAEPRGGVGEECQEGPCLDSTPVRLDTRLRGDGTHNRVTRCRSGWGWDETE